MSEIAKIRDLFARFEKTGSLESLIEAIEIIEDVLENVENAEDKELALKFFNLYKKKQIEEARRILKQEDDLDKVKVCWEILDKFIEAKFANSAEDIDELEKVKGELSKREDEVKPKSPEERKAQQDENNRYRRAYDKILMDKAKDAGITVTEAEIDKYIEDR